MISYKILIWKLATKSALQRKEEMEIKRIIKEVEADVVIRTKKGNRKKRMEE